MRAGKSYNQVRICFSAVCTRVMLTEPSLVMLHTKSRYWYGVLGLLDIIPYWNMCYGLPRRINTKKDDWPKFFCVAMLPRRGNTDLRLLKSAQPLESVPSTLMVSCARFSYPAVNVTKSPGSYMPADSATLETHHAQFASNGGEKKFISDITPFCTSLDVFLLFIK